jgi:hypothetical protein
VPRLIAPLLDAVALLAFAALGRRNHGEQGGIEAVVRTALPFLAAWLVVALAAGVWRRPLDLRRAALAWLLAWPLALLLRWLGGRGVAPAFAAVALLFNLATLVGWRALARWRAS